MTSAGEAFDSSGSAVGMIMAVRDINANSSVLPNYTLTHTRVVDSQVRLDTYQCCLGVSWIVLVIQAGVGLRAIIFK